MISSSFHSEQVQVVDVSKHLFPPFPYYPINASIARERLVVRNHRIDRISLPTPSVNLEGTLIGEMLLLGIPMFHLLHLSSARLESGI
jgi:hypothetical protein